MHEGYDEIYDLAGLIDECHQIAQEKGFWELDARKANKPYWPNIMGLMQNITRVLDRARKEGIPDDVSGCRAARDFGCFAADAPLAFMPQPERETPYAHVCKQLAHIIIEATEAFERMALNGMGDEDFHEELVDIAIVLFDLVGHLLGGEAFALLLVNKMDINRHREKRYGVA
jgi:hypothetical protein